MIRNLLLTASVLALTGAVSMPAQAQSAAGAYLAGRHAAVRSDFAESARYYGEALALDPKNPEFLESTVLALLSLGNIERALPLARVMAASDQPGQIAYLVTTAGMAQEEDYAGLNRAIGRRRWDWPLGRRAGQSLGTNGASAI